jgi:hypothetical protein
VHAQEEVEVEEEEEEEEEEEKNQTRWIQWWSTYRVVSRKVELPNLSHISSTASHCFVLMIPPGLSKRESATEFEREHKRKDQGEDQSCMCSTQKYKQNFAGAINTIRLLSQFAHTIELAT